MLPTVTSSRYVARTQGTTTLTVTSPTDASSVAGSPVTVAGTTVPGNKIYVAATNTDANSATTIASTTAAADGSFSVDVAVTGGTSVINVVAVDASGGTAHVARTVVFDFVPGTVLLDVTDPDGDDNGPGNYAYPTSDNFQPGAYDIEQFQVFDAGSDVIFRLKTRDLTPTFGSPLGAQLVDVYVHDPGAATTSTTAANAIAQLHHCGAICLEPSHSGAGLRSAIRRCERGNARYGVDQRQLDFEIHHVPCLEGITRRAGSGVGLHCRPHRPGRLQLGPGQRLPADAAGLPVRGVRDVERRPALHVQPRPRTEGRRRDHSGRRAPVGRAGLHAAQPRRPRGHHDSVRRGD